MDIGKKLKELRQLENMTQKEAAVKLNISRSALTNYEANRRTLSPDMLVRFSKLYNVTVDYILDNDL